jgi:hypothetical protein
MTIKYKVLKDFQLLTEDKKIIILKAKTVIEDFKFKTKTETVTVPTDIIKNNPEYFAYIDWKEELQNHLKTNKIAQPAVISKKLIPFIEYLMSSQTQTTKEVFVEKEVIKEVVVEKPKIVEKEVVVEKLINDNSLTIELENKLNKVTLKENQLDIEIQNVNIKELELLGKEKSLNDKEKTLNDLDTSLSILSKDLIEKENDLSQREIKVLEKENNLSAYITLGRVNEKIAEYEERGFNMSLFRKLTSEL